MYIDDEGILWIEQVIGLSKLNFNNRFFSYYCGVFEVVFLVVRNWKWNFMVRGRVGGGFNTIGKSPSGECFYRFLGLIRIIMLPDDTFCIGADGSIWMEQTTSGLRDYDPDIMS